MKKILYIIGSIILMIIIFYIANVIYAVLQGHKGIPVEPITDEIVCVTFPC